MKLSDLPDIEFVSADEQEILSDIIKLYTEITGRTLAQGDPVRLFFMRDCGHYPDAVQ